MFRISRTTPAYYFTCVAHNRLPIFQKDTFKQLVCSTFEEARRSGGFYIFAYVIMFDHYHMITSSQRPATDVLRFLNGITARRLIDHLAQNGFESSLEKLRVQERDRRHKHVVFQHHPNIFEIYGEETMMQKTNYIHLNPVRAAVSDHPDEYRFSSARQWHNRTLEDEPLLMDHKQIKWR